ncbi:hypothetical protein [Humibacter albus]|uniref:hypothetical protein n=1 Tax=Humibacter albus TaxID=427754 RepID=UPI0003B4F594|nr:hypothetical protein [Humibacter albus]
MTDQQPDRPETESTASRPVPADEARAPQQSSGPSSNLVLKSALLWGGLLALAIAVVASVVGGLVAGGVGVVSALIGTAMAVVYLGITAASILLANRFTASDLFVGIFFGIVLGAWLVKFVLFIVVAILLKGQPWVNPQVMFLTMIVGVIGSLVVDVVVVLRSRMPYASDTRLPGGR